MVQHCDRGTGDCGVARHVVVTTVVGIDGFRDVVE